MLGWRRTEGDTIVEVLFAVTVFSLVVVGALSLINQGTAASQRALEITLVRQQIDAQAETLRFMHDSYVARYQPTMTYNLTDAVSTPDEEWYRMMEYVKAYNPRSASSFGTCPDYTADSPQRGSFVLDPVAAKAVLRSAYPESLKHSVTWANIERNAGVVTSNGIWIEAIRSTNSTDVYQANIGYIDFHIRACWDAPGLSAPMHLGTIVRLYEPR